MPVNPAKDSPTIQAIIRLAERLWGVEGYGWRAKGSVPGSLHPSGRAADLMTSNKAQGDKIAKYFVDHAGTLGITEVIWWGRIWTPGKGWHDYTGPSPHRDHVHVGAGRDGGINLPDIPNPLNAVGDVVGKAISGSVNDLKRAGFTIVFAAAGLGLIVLGAQQMVTPTVRRAVGL